MLKSGDPVRIIDTNQVAVVVRIHDTWRGPVATVRWPTRAQTQHRVSQLVPVPAVKIERAVIVGGQS